jgi:hypothetical protein
MKYTGVHENDLMGLLVGPALCASSAWTSSRFQPIQMEMLHRLFSLGCVASARLYTTRSALRAGVQAAGVLLVPRAGKLSPFASWTCPREQKCEHIIHLCIII